MIKSFSVTTQQDLVGWLKQFVNVKDMKASEFLHQQQIAKSYLIRIQLEYEAQS